MEKLTYYKNGHKLIVSEMSAKLAPPELEGWTRENKAKVPVPSIAKKFIDTTAQEKPKSQLPFLAEQLNPETDNVPESFVDEGAIAPKQTDPEINGDNAEMELPVIDTTIPETETLPEPTPAPLPKPKRGTTSNKPKKL